MADNIATKKKKKKKSKKPFVILSVVFTALFIVFGYMTAKNLMTGKTVESPVPNVEPTTAKVNTAFSDETPDLIGELKVNDGNAVYLKDMLDFFKPLYASNPDTIGWLKIPNTSIDTVVVQHKDDDGHIPRYQYLKNDFYGNFTRYGNIFLDYRCLQYQLSSNTIIYGHTTVGKEQAFYDLVKYEKPEFFKQNPVIEYDTLYNRYKWKVFGVFVTSVNAADDNGYIFDYISPSMGPMSKEGYLKQVDERVLYKTGVEVNGHDKILTLSTCSYNFTVRGTEITSRLVVVARLLRDGESEDIDASLVKDNPNYRRPQRWYDLTGQKNPYANSERWKASKY
ncbi:MAG: class B sortase [Clostridiales bacterium]|nr:class B sortase [Clostridiales bacterium]